jgi:hypothetical protein
MDKYRVVSNIEKSRVKKIKVGKGHIRRLFVVAPAGMSNLLAKTEPPIGA